MNGDKIAKFAAFTERIGLPGALLFLVCIGLYFGAVDPLVAVASDHIRTQTKVLEDVACTIKNINVVVEADRAERKAEAIDGVTKLLERHDHEMTMHLEQQTRILERLALILEKERER